MAGDGDTVTARAAPELPAGTVIIEHIDGDGGRLSRDPEENCGEGGDVSCTLTLGGWGEDMSADSVFLASQWASRRKTRSG